MTFFFIIYRKYYKTGIITIGNSIVIHVRIEKSMYNLLLWSYFTKLLKCHNRTSTISI